MSEVHKFVSDALIIRLQLQAVQCCGVHIRQLGQRRQKGVEVLSSVCDAQAWLA